jgi:L,D-transpeptidase catalytic domain
VSSGCIRLTNEDITDLYKRVKVGTRVVVLSGKERANTAAPVVTSTRAGSAARSGAPSDTEVTAKKHKPSKELEREPQTTSGWARGETTEANGNTPRLDAKSEHAGFEE